MSYRGRWTEPDSSRELRDEYRALRRRLKKSALSSTARAEIESRLDTIAANGSPTGNGSSLPTASSAIQEYRWVQVEKPAAQPPVAVEPESNEPLPEPDFREAVPYLKHDETLSALDKRCVLLLAHLQVLGHSIRDAFENDYEMIEAFFSLKFVLSDLDRIEGLLIRHCGEVPVSSILPPRDACRDNRYSVMHRKATRYFRSRPAKERAHLQEVFEAQKQAPGWEKLLEWMNGSLTELASQDVKPAAIAPARDRRTDAEIAAMAKRRPLDETSLPEGQASLAEHVLATDGWLTKLADYNSGALRSQILSAIAEQLLKARNADASFLAALYERSDLTPS